MRIQIRTIRDILGRQYDIYDLIGVGKQGREVSLCTYDSMDEIRRWHGDLPVENLSKLKKNKDK